MKAEVLKSLNNQLHAEYYSSYLYLSMSAWAASNGYKGISNWMFLQSQEEYGHAIRFFNFIADRGEVISLQTIAAPSSNWSNVTELFKATLEHEKKITDSINNLYSVAVENKDHATCSFLQWFLDEQVEEEKTVTEILDQLKLIGNDGPGLYLLDRELSARQAEATTTQE
ncbi:MAG: ferritin [Bacteroidales bacterium]